MRSLSQKPKETPQNKTSDPVKPTETFPGQDQPVSSILYLQRKIGNQAVQRLLQPAPEPLEADSANKASSGLDHEFNRIPTSSPAPVHVQPKLLVNTPGDPYEREADLVADQMMRMPTPQVESTIVEGRLKRKASQPGQEQEPLRTKRVQPNSDRETVAPPVVHDVLRSPGQPLASAAREFFEPRFGHNLSPVRVHTDTLAAAAARAVSAKAFTAGKDIVFGAGRYSPAAGRGRRLLAHELTHVVQQASTFHLTNRASQGEISHTVHQTHAPLIQRDVDPTYRDRLEQMSDQQLNQELLDIETTLNNTLSLGPEWSDLIEQQRMVLDVLDRRGFPLADPGTQGRMILGQARGGPSGGRFPIRAYYFQGRTTERALVIGGVHGSEQSGAEVANLLVESLQTGPSPHFTTIVVPVLFPANLAAAQAASLPICPSRGCDPIRPGRVTPGEVDPNRQYPPIGYSLATARREGGALGPVDEQGRPMEPETVILLDLIDRFRPSRIASVHAHSMRGRARRDRDMPGIFGERSDPMDDALAIAMAQRAEHGGARVPGNWLGTARPEPDYPPSAPRLSAGTSLGEWASSPITEGGAHDRPAMTIITVEVQHYHPSSAELTAADRNRRLRELEAHRDAIREIFLESP